MVGLPTRGLRGDQAPVDLVEGLPVDLEGDVLEASDLRVHRLGTLVHLRVGELEEGQGAAVTEPEEGVAIGDLALDVRVEDALAPGGDQGQPEHVLEKLAIRLLVAHDEGVVMQARWQVWEQGRSGAGVAVVHGRILLGSRSVPSGVNGPRWGPRSTRWPP